MSSESDSELEAELSWRLLRCDDEEAASVWEAVKGCLFLIPFVSVTAKVSLGG